MQKYLLLLRVDESWPLISNWPRAYLTLNHWLHRASLYNIYLVQISYNIHRWRPPTYIRERTEEQHQKLREKFHIIVEGEDIPPPIEHFQDMKIPKPMLEFLKSARITTPTPIQLQGIPTGCAFSQQLMYDREIDKPWQFLRSRYDRDSLHWVWKNPYILSPAHHDGP